MPEAGDRGDALLEATVLELVLSRHHARFTATDLARELGAASQGRSDRSTVDRVIASLVEVGLLYRDGDFVLPSPAARRFDQLLGG